jgi:cytidine deaminase
MQTKQITISVSEYKSTDELPEEDKKLVFLARNAAERAYAPYSKFKVGAAMRLDNGEIIDGNNQENAAYTNGLCAERVALFFANSRFPKAKVETIAVTAKNENGLVAEPVKPCGSCRQAILEAEVRFEKPIRIILDGKNSIHVFDGIENLLPFAFKPDALG